MFFLIDLETTTSSTATPVGGYAGWVGATRTAAQTEADVHSVVAKIAKIVKIATKSMLHRIAQI